MDFDHLIIDLVRKAEPDLDSRLESQAEALKELECINHALGRWIDEYDVEYLMAAFSLDDGEFSSSFPTMGHLNQDNRKQIIEAFENHFDQCPHCYLKRGYDLEMNARLERAYVDNNVVVAQHLQSAKMVAAREDEAVSDDVINVDDLTQNAAAARDDVSDPTVVKRAR